MSIIGWNFVFCVRVLGNQQAFKLYSWAVYLIEACWRIGLGTCVMPSHYLNQCWPFVLRIMVKPYDFDTVLTGTVCLFCLQASLGPGSGLVPLSATYHVRRKETLCTQPVFRWAVNSLPSVVIIWLWETKSTRTTAHCAAGKICNYIFRWQIFIFHPIHRMKNECLSSDYVIFVKKKKKKKCGFMVGAGVIGQPFLSFLDGTPHKQAW